jgi:hypothetical protein
VRTHINDASRKGNANLAKLNGVKLVSESITYNGVTYVKSTGKAEVGDVIRIGEESVSFITDGEFYAITADSDGVPVFTDDDGDELGISYLDEPPTLFKPLTSAVSPHEVKRKASVGERIKIVKATFNSGTYSNGDTFDVIRANSSGVEIDKRGRDIVSFVWHSEYVVLVPVTEPIAQPPVKSPEKAQTPALKVGDYVKVVRDGGFHDYTVGDIVKITRIDTVTEEGTLFYGESVTTGKRGNCLSTKQTVMVTSEEVAEASVTAKWAAIGRKVGEIRVGDVVRSLGHTVNAPKGTLGIAEYGHNFAIPCMGIRDSSGKLWSAHNGAGLELIAPVESLFSV